MLPFVRPTIESEELQAVEAVMRSGQLASGPKVLEFEAALMAYFGNTSKVLAINTGTSALEACVLACGIGPGDEVIVPAMSFVASANVVLRAGATPVFVDVDLHTRNLSAAQIEPKITPRTRAIIPVHFAGLPVEMDPIYALARKHKLRVIEDAAHAIGTRYNGKLIGAQGDLICFSFHPNKNMTTIEGGAIASFDNNLIKPLQQIRFHGITRDAEGNQDVPAWGGKMNLADVNAALGIVQLRKLEQFNAKRVQLIEHYYKVLPKHPALIPPGNGPGHSWHIFAVLIDFARLGISRSQFQQRLQKLDIGSGVHYPAMHLFGAYQRFGYRRGDFPNSEQIGDQTLTLPLFPAMTTQDVDKVCAALHQILQELSHGK